MKKIFYIILFIFIATTYKGQNFYSDRDYYYTRMFLEPVPYGTSESQFSSKKQSQTVKYYGKLGRLEQTIIIKGTPLGNDIVIPNVYDKIGREAKKYLPLPQSQTKNGGFYFSYADSSDIDSLNAVSLYHSTSLYGETDFEKSPLGRIKRQAAPGEEWKLSGNHTKNFSYSNNVSSDNVYHFISTASWNATEKKLNESISFRLDDNYNTSAKYNPNTLNKFSTTDEDGNTIILFENGKGQTILVRKLDGANTVDTYYVYDQWGLLAYIIPPLAVDKIKESNSIDSSVINKLCYQYLYDKNKRLIEKNIPGKGLELFVYDEQNRLVLSQDSKQRTNGQWSFNKYDNLGRIIYTGIGVGGTRIFEQDNIVNKGLNNESYSTTGFSKSNRKIYYTNSQSYPSGGITDVLGINYYDRYPINSPIRSTSILEQNTIPDISSYSSVEITTKGLPTASMIKNVEDNRWTDSYVWYDNKTRAIGGSTVNYLGGHTKSETSLDFTGHPLISNVYHKRLSSSVEVKVAQRFVYDDSGRLLKQYHKVDNNPEELLSFYSYNELGQVVQKQVGGVDNSPVQTIDYNYNVRGWLTGVNLDANGNVQTNKLFSYKLNYQKPLEITNTTPFVDDTSIQVKPRYNGSISEVTWFSGTDTSIPIKKYGYVYDKLNRLNAGFYYIKQGNGYTFTQENNEIVSNYDSNGNIGHLKRFAYNIGTEANLIDDLTYEYDGNQLTNVTDDAENSSGFEGTSKDPIGYDDNGNITSFPAKNISAISYNYLNLPTEININSESQTTLNYFYRADGTKIKKVNVTVFGGTNGGATKTSSSEYLDGFQYLVTKTTRNSGGIEEEIEALPPSRAMEIEAFSVENRISIGNPGGTQVEASVLQFFPTAEGYYDYQRKLYIYQYKDHLGNVRLSYTKNQSGSIDVLDQNDYYPFGMNHLNTSTALFGDGNLTNYKYNAKELQESGLYDYGWRQYMSDIGRWNGIDMLAESYVSTNPYAYVMNNPISFIDPDGRYTTADGGYSNPQLDWWAGAMGSVSSRQGDIPAGGGFGTPYNFGSSNAPNLSWDWINNILNKSSGNTTWTNNGSGFTSTNGTAIDYFGNWTSLNINYSNGGIGEKYIEIPIVYLTGNSSNWGSQMQSHFNSYMEKWNNNPLKLFAEGFEYTDESNFGSGSSWAGYAGLNLNKYETLIKISAKGSNFNNLRHVSKTLKNVGSVGKAFGWAGVGLSVYEDYKEDKLGWGTGAKVGIGIACIYLGPVGVVYGIADITVGITTGTTITDRVASGIDNAIKGR